MRQLRQQIDVDRQGKNNIPHHYNSIDIDQQGKSNSLIVPHMAEMILAHNRNNKDSKIRNMVDIVQLDNRCKQYSLQLSNLPL